MAVGVLAWAESHTTAGQSSASQASFAFQETLNTSTARCVVVFVFSIAATGQDTSVTVAGTVANLISGLTVADTATEPGCVRTYFLDSCPQSATASVVVNRTNNATLMYAVAMSFTALGATEIYLPGAVLLQENGTLAEQLVDDGSPGTDSARVAACYYGGAAPAPAGATSTLSEDNDLGAFGCSVVRDSAVGQGPLSVGFAQATADDRAAVHFAVREVPAAPPALPQRPYRLNQAVHRASNW